MGKKGPVWSVRLRLSAMCLNYEAIKQIVTALNNLFERPIKEFVGLWRREKEKEGKVLDPDDILTCYEICKEKCQPRYTLQIVDRRAEKIVEINHLDELEVYLRSYNSRNIKNFTVSIAIENYGISMNFSNTISIPSAIIIQSTDERWLHQACDALQRVISPYRCRNHLVNNIITMTFITAVTFMMAFSALTMIVDKKYYLFMIIPALFIGYGIFYGLMHLCRFLFPLLKFKKIKRNNIDSIKLSSIP